ncbi:MAG: thymidine phosphorylase [Puniceicoccales bacterium]|jgi:pyrimidine-nucleoside phosphorylase|nr:thymidine phosphorylase [Puniceicoccales bacterium]
MREKTKKKMKPSFAFLIEKKRDGEEFTRDEIKGIVDALIDEELPPHQLAGLLSVIYFRGLTIDETAILAEELMLSGEVLNLASISLPKVASYTTGGVGDKVPLILPAIAAACGVVMPVMVGEDENFLIGTLDKLSAIPGFCRRGELKEFSKYLHSNGAAFMEQHESISPIDNVIYKMRREIAAIPCPSLIVASILARKSAEGADGFVVDVKWGNGSFIKDVEQAKVLARNIARTCDLFKRRCVVLVTDVNQPIGSSVGTALEIEEAVRFLKTEEGDEDLRQLILRTGMEVVRIAGVAGSTLSAKQMVQRSISSGAAFEKFKQIIAAQGGDVSYLDNTEKFPKAKYIRKLSAPKRGYIHTINAGMIARGVQLLSERSDGTFDPSVGVSQIMKVGVQIKQGEPLMMIHYNDGSNLESGLEYLRNSFRLAPKRPNVGDLIVERIA